jgi:N-acyl homoserine lactone hydrolase
MRIHALQTGRVRIKQAQIAGRGHGFRRRLQPVISREWADWLPVYAFAVEHPEGVIVVDTGANAGLKKLPRWHPYFRFAVLFDVEPEQEVGPQLRSLGIGAHDVKIVVLTHMHIDHDAGVCHFPYSRVLADGGELDRASGIGGRLRGYLPGRWPVWFDPQPLVWRPGNCGPFAASAPLTAAADVVAVPTPGHTPNHISVVVRDGPGAVVLAGDASYLEATMLGGTIDGVASNEAEARATLAQMRRLCMQQSTVYLPAHDPRSWERLRDRRPAAIAAGGEAA